MFKQTRLLLLSVVMVSASVLSLPANSSQPVVSKVEQRLPAAKDNSIIQQRQASYCTFLANVFYAVAELRDKKVAPLDVYNSMMGSELPEDIKANAAQIVTLVYSTPELAPDEIGFAIFGQCMEQQTGVRRHT